MFGAYFYGQSLYGGSQVEPTNLRPNAGGMFGAATFGQSYYGQQIFFGPTPAPVPPTPKPVGGGGGGGGTSGRKGRTRRTLFIPDSQPEQEYQVIKFSNLKRIFEEDIFDVSESVSKTGGQIVRAARSNPVAESRFYGAVSAVSEISSDSKSSQYFKGFVYGTASKNGDSKSSSSSFENTVANAYRVSKTRSKSSFYGFAAPLVEAGSSSDSRNASFYGWANGDSVTTFTDSQIELLTLIAQEAFFDE